MKLEAHLKRAKAYRPVSYLHKFAAPKLQKAIRLEASDGQGHIAMKDGKPQRLTFPKGYCACVTCGCCGHWKYMNAGHFLATRRPSIVLDERGIHPQCVACNMTLSGNPDMYHKFMVHCYGLDVIDDLQDLRDNVSKHWTIEELVRLRMEYDRRIKDALDIIGG